MSNLRNVRNPFEERIKEQSALRRSRRLENLSSKRFINSHKNYVGENHQIPIENITISNPYKTKNNTIFKDLNPYNQETKLKRYTYSKYINSYELDLMFFTYNNNLEQAIYLVLININTRFVYIVLIPDKSIESIKRAIYKLIYYGLKITHVRYDGEGALNSQEMKEFWENINVNVHRSTSKFTNKSRIVDRFIRTLRDLYFNTVGNKNISYENQHTLMQELVTYYNNTPHSTTGIKPTEMTYQQEYEYIDTMNKLTNIQKQKQYKEGLYNFQYGDKIKIYINPSKTNESYVKKRGNYVYEATFIEYNHGNVICELNKNIIEIPIYWLKPDN